MGKLLVVLLGLGAVLGGAYHYLSENAGPSEVSEPSAPRRQLDNVRGAADRIEDDAQRRADDLLERTK